MKLDSPIAFDVTIPSPGCVMVVELTAADWIEAWQRALSEIGIRAGPSDVDCGIYPGDKVVVTVKATGVRLELRSRGRLERPAEPAPQRTKHPTPVLRLPIGGRRGERRALGDLVMPGPIPRVGMLDSAPEAAAAQILDMLVAHLGATTTLFIGAARRGRRPIRAGRGALADALGDDAALIDDTPWLQLADDQPLRLGFAEPSSLTFKRIDGVLQTTPIRNVAAAPVRGGGMFLLLDGPNPDGFSDGELDALAYAAELVSRRRVV